MSGIAKMLLEKGYRITGSDLKENGFTDRLKELGATIYVGHRADNLGTPDLVVVSSAIHEGNPELALARSRGIPVVHRMDALLMAVEGKRLIAVAGAHGKTTTTSMIAWTLVEAGADPTFLVAGEFGGRGNERSGNGDYAVFETDESDGSFLKVRADIAVATNVDNDHLEHWGTVDAIKGAFYRYLDSVRPGGVPLACSDDPCLREYAAGRPNVQTYATGRTATWEARDFRANGWGSACRVLRDGADVAFLELSVPGLHNVQNALGALAASCAAGLSPEDAAKHLSRFGGAKRRLERIAEIDGVLLLDEFAHHPREIAASLCAVRTTLPGRAILVVFQPHRFSRTRLLAKEISESLSGADRIIVTGIYAGPGEEPEAGVSSSLVTLALSSLGHEKVTLVEEKEEAAKLAASLARPGDVIVTVGAGDVWKTHGTIIKTLENRRSNR